MTHSLLVALIFITSISFGIELENLYEWKYIDFLWKSPKQKQEAIESGNYNTNACVLFDVDRAPDGRVFVTSVRDQGVPASLMTVSDEVEPGGPLLSPYSNWSWYKNDNKCNSIISVYRVSIECNHLFVLDCGKIGENPVCPPQLLIFDLRTNRLVKRIIIPSDIANNEDGAGLLVTLLPSVQDCRHINDATMFMADVEGYGLTMYNRYSGICRIESDFMKPTDPIFTIANQSFSLQDGIFGLTLVHKDLYYAALAGNKVYKIHKYNLRKCSKLRGNAVDAVTQLAGTLSGQTGPIASEQCAILFSNIPKMSTLCADATKKFDSSNTEIVAQDLEKLQFTSGLKVTNYGRKSLVLTNRLQCVFTNTLNLDETNFRILRIDVVQIRKETNRFASCKHHSYKTGHHVP